MHELAIAESLVKILENEAQSGEFARVTRVRLDIGALSTVVPESLSFCFEVAAKDTRAENAVLEITIIPATATCRTCGKTFEITEYATPCPSCNNYGIDRATGDDLRIRDMEVE